MESQDATTATAGFIAAVGNTAATRDASDAGATATNKTPWTILEPGDTRKEEQSGGA